MFLLLIKNFDSHICYFVKVFQRFRKNGIKLKREKMLPFKTRRRVLGENCGKEKRQSWFYWHHGHMKPPTYTQEVERFCGFANYHRSFIKDFSKLQLLYMNFQENSFTMRRKAWTFLRVSKVHKWVLQSYPFQWKRESSILIPTLRTLPKGLNYNKLKMMFNCVLHIFTLTREQKKYCTTREESLAVVWFTCHFSHYLLGRPFDIRTDHSSLQ